MEQPWNQQREGGDFAMGESISCHAADLDQAMMTEVDGAFLMELMEDLPRPSSDLLQDGDGDVDLQLSHVIRSLESEIGGSDHQAAAPVTMADGDHREILQTRIEDVLSSEEDMDGYQGASSSFEYWPQVGSSLLLAGGHDEAEGWCVYTNGGYEGGVDLGYDTVDHHYYCCVESSADHMYLSLWE